MKRVISAILALVMVLSLVPVLRMEAKAEETDVYTLVEQQIKAYASSINQNDAARTAAIALLTNAAFLGKDLTFDESSAMTAMIFNSYMFQDALIHSCTEMVHMMQQLNADSLACGGDFEWRSKTAAFHLYGRSKPGRDYTDQLCTVARSSLLYGSSTYLLDKYNSYDKMLVSVAGQMQLDYTISVVERREDTVVYHIELKAGDDFDFDGDYGDSKYNRDYEELLTMFGALTLKDFSWESNVSFRIEAPHACNHSTGSYRWVQDMETRELVCDTSDGYISNPARKQTYTSTNSDGETTYSYYYQLQDPVVLKHDIPWVVTYDMAGIVDFMMSPLLGSRSRYPYIWQYNRYFAWIGYYEKEYLTKEQQAEYGTTQTTNSTAHFFGFAISDAYKHYSSHRYNYTLENIIAEDGSNMVYVTVYDYDLGQVVFGPEPMDDQRITNEYVGTRVLVSQENDWLNGQDIIINYIGNSERRVNKNLLSVEIYENGVDGETQDTYVEKMVAPTCTSQGYTAHTCTKCGYSYKTDYVEKLSHDYKDTVVSPTCTAEGYTSHTCKACGYSHNTDVVPMVPHTFDNYVSNNDATCAHDGTKTGKCTICGASDTVTDEGTALPHDWMNATCTKAQTCRVCDGTEGDPLGHDLKYYNAKAPTCTDVGWDAYEKCQRCRYSTFATMPALGHDYVNGVCQNCGDGDVLLGDLNGDGEVDIFDANLIVAYYNGTADLTAAQQKAADVNGDGEVDIFDANLIVSFYNGTIDKFPAE